MKHIEIEIVAFGVSVVILLHRKRGYDILGIDISPRANGFDRARSLVDAGQVILRNAGCPGRLIWAPPGTVPAMEGRFNAAITGWSGYMYIPRRAQRLKPLRDFRGLLVEGGPLLLSFQTRELCERRMDWSTRAANWIRKIRGVEPVVVGDRLDSGFKHWFNREDISGEMAEAGLRMKWYGVDGYAGR
jgi:hypothetical protein